MPAVATEPKARPPSNLYHDGQARELEAPWEDIKTIVQSGVSMVKAAKRFAHCHPNGYKGMLEVIKKRAQRGGWISPRTIMGKAREQAREMGIDVPALSQPSSKALSDPEKTGTFIAENLEEMGKEGSMIAGQINLELLRRAQANPEEIAPLADTKDVAVSLKSLRLVAGMDKQLPPVSFNLWSDPARAAQRVPRDIEAVADWSDGDEEQV